MSATGFAEILECYEILGIEEGVDWKEVKQAYHQLAKLYHPDMNPEYRGEARFKKISRAFQVLEKHYRDNPLPEPSTFLEKVPDLETETDDDVFDVPPKEPSFRNKLENGLRHSLEYLKEVERKALLLDVITAVQVDPQTAQKGGIIRVRTASGHFQVRVPGGMQEDQVMRIPGKGERGLLNTQRGDLVLRIQIQSPQAPDEKCEDFYYQVTVTAEELSRWTLRTLETHEGPIRYTLPRNTQTGQTFTLKARKSPGQSQSANHIIVVEVVPG